MNPTVVPSSEDGRAAGCAPAAFISLVGSRTRKIMSPLLQFVVSDVIAWVRLPFQPFGGSQSMQAPMAAVTALVLLPIQGAMTAPKPPAGPPAATTRR